MVYHLLPFYVQDIGKDRKYIESIEFGEYFEIINTSTQIDKLNNKGNELTAVLL